MFSTIKGTNSDMWWAICLRLLVETIYYVSRQYFMVVSKHIYATG